MTDVFTPPPGDPDAFKAAGRRLGEVAGSLAATKDRFRDAQGQVIASVYSSNSATRLTELTNGLRGVEAEFDHLRRAGERVAELVSQQGQRLVDLEDDLQRWRHQVHHVETEAEQAGPDGSSPAATRAHTHARRTRGELENQASSRKEEVLGKESGIAAEISGLAGEMVPGCEQLSPEAIRRVTTTSRGSGWVRAGLADGTFSTDDAWLVMGFAYEEVADDDAAREKSRTSHQVVGGFGGFFDALGETFTDTKDAVLHPVETTKGLWSFGGRLWDDPTGTAGEMWDQFEKPFVTDWKRQEYGRAFGRGLESLVELAVGTKGTLKVTKETKLARAEHRRRIAVENINAAPKWADGGAIPTRGGLGQLFDDEVYRFGDLTREEFLAKYWNARKGSWRYPRRKGFVGLRRANTLQTGDIIDRFGGTRGKFASPEKTPYAQRAIPPSSIGQEYHRYQVIKRLPKAVKQGKVAKWFEQPGGGRQFVFDKPIEWYLKEGYLVEVQ